MKNEIVKLFARYKVKTLDYYEHHEKQCDIAIFIGGFLFDILTLGGVDDTFAIVQQCIYFTLLIYILFYEIRSNIYGVPFPFFLNPVWIYHRLATHFMLGSLLSVYTIFYFKSGSFISSFLFISIVAGAMVLNEFPFFQKLGSVVRSALFALCLNSFSAQLTPMLFKKVGAVPFYTSQLFSALAIIILFLAMRKGLESDRLNLKTMIHEHIFKQFLAPGLGTITLFITCYFFGLIPPVPVSLNYIGIYHNITKPADAYQLHYTRPKWRFWEKGDQTFEAVPGDLIHCFVQVYSPTNFQDAIELNWYYKDLKNNWKQSDSIPISIKGGRKDGYRGYGTKQNFWEGKWQVRVVMSDDKREIGRINFEVVPKENPELPPEYQIDEK